MIRSVESFGYWFFFFSSRRRHTRLQGDWSSDVCSYDLFLDPAWGYGYSVRGPNDGMSFALGWSSILIAVAAWIWSTRHPKPMHRALMRFFAAAAAEIGRASCRAGCRCRWARGRGKEEGA